MLNLMGPNKSSLVILSQKYQVLLKLPALLTDFVGINALIAALPLKAEIVILVPLSITSFIFSEDRVTATLSSMICIAWKSLKSAILKVIHSSLLSGL